MKRVGIQRGIYLLPSLCTTASMFCAFFSILKSIAGDYRSAAIFIFVSGLFDMTDGRLARMTRTQSEFGREYDSLVDMAAFGLAPAILIYTWGVSSFKPFGWLFAFLYFACASLRLARFNVQVDSVEKKKFQGLPTPPAAGLLASLVVFYQEYFGKAHTKSYVALGLLLVLALLMVSNIRYRSFKEYDVQKTNSLYALIGAALVIGIIAINPEVILFAGFSIYALSGPVSEVLFFSQRRKPVKAQTAGRRFSIVEPPKTGDRHG